MENWIERVLEPQRLYLAWQAPDHMGDRHRWAVGILERTGDECTLEYLYSGAEFEGLNQGRNFEQLLALGYQGYPAFPLRRAMHIGGVLAAFTRRLPPRSRSDFQEYKRQFRLAPGVTVSDFALLGLTEAKLPSDGFSVVDPLDPAAHQCDLMLDVAGYRYYADKVQLAVGDPVLIQAEPANRYDPGAVMVSAAGEKIGNINRLQAKTFRHWLNIRRVSAVIERLNGRVGKPRAYIFTRVRPAA